MNSTIHLKRLALTDKIRKEIEAVKSERTSRRGHVRTILGDEPGWVVFERELVQRLVNAELAKNGVTPVDINEIVSVEQAAAYSKHEFAKAFAQNAADLILKKTAEGSLAA